MTRNIVFLLLTLLMFTSTTASAQNWWWSKKKDATPQQPTTTQKTTKRPPSTLDHITNLKNSMASPEALDKAVAKTRASDYKNARSYAEKQRAKIARDARAATLQRAITWEKKNAKSEEQKATATNPYYNQYTKDAPTTAQPEAKKRYIYKPKSSQTQHKKPPRVFNTID